MAAYKFKLLSGRHQDGRTIYKAGENDVVESDQRLDLLFVNKFRRLTGRVDDEEPTTPTRKAKRLAREEPSPAAREEALEETIENAEEEALEEGEERPGRRLMRGVKDKKEKKTGSARGQHARAGQEGGSEEEEDLQPEEETDDEGSVPGASAGRPMNAVDDPDEPAEEEPIKPRRKPRVVKKRK